MNTYEQKRAFRLIMIESRKAAYFAAVAERDAIAAFAKRSDAIEYDLDELEAAEARVELALNNIKDWGDPLPDAATESPTLEIIESDAPEVLFAPFPSASGVSDTAEALAARILASDRLPGAGCKNAEVDAIAARIAAA